MNSKASSRALIARARISPLSAPLVQPAPARILRLSTETEALLKALPDYWKATAAELDGLLALRISGFNGKLAFALAISIAAILMALGLAVVFLPQHP